MGSVNTSFEQGLRSSVIRCPDCPEHFASHQAFVAHREEAHPPRPIEIAGAGAIDSRARFGTDPKE